MSHHLDTPEAAERGQLFIDDLFVFRGDGSTVLVLDVNSDVNGKVASPDFWPGARYEFHLHVDGAEQESLTFRAEFGEPDADGQSVRLVALTGADAAQDAAAGQLLLEGRTGQPVTVNGVRLWAGRAHDPFFFDLSLLEPISSAVTGGTAPDLSQWNPADAENTFGGKTVASTRPGGPGRLRRLDARAPGSRCGSPPSSRTATASTARSTAAGCP